MIDTEHLESSFDIVNLNDYCLLDPTETVTEQYRKYNGDLTSFDMRNGSLALPIHQLMRIFGPLFTEDFEQPPFRKVTLSFFPSMYEHSSKRVLKVADFIFLRLTKVGAKRVSYALSERNGFRPEGELSSIQFGRMLNIFYPSTYIIGGQPIENNTLYIPKV